MSERHDDNLENFFKSRLNEQSGSKDWNLPSEGLFDAAMDTIDSQKKSDKKSYRGLIFIGLALAILTSSALLFLRHANSLNDKLSSYEQEIQSLNEKNELLENQNVAFSHKLESLESNNDVTGLNESSSESDKKSLLNRKEVGAVSQEEKEDSPNSITEKISTRNALGLSSTGFTSSGRPSEIHPIENRTEEVTGIVSKAEKRETTPSTPVTKSLPEMIVGIGTLPVLSLMEFDYIREPLSGVEFTSITSPDVNASVGLYSVALKASYVQSALTMKNIEEDNYTLTEYDQFYNGHDIGLFIDRSIGNKFSVETGLKWTRMNNHSLYQAELTYDQDNEFVASDGSLVYRNQMDILSPLGAINMDDIVEMNDAVSDQELMKNKTHIDLRHDYIGLSVGIRYEAFRWGKFSTQLGLASELNYIVRSSSRLNTSLYRQNDEMASYETLAETSQLDPLFVSLVGSVGLNYALTDSWGISLSGSYGRSLNSLKKTNAQDVSSTFINSRNLSLGLSYRF